MSFEASQLPTPVQNVYTQDEKIKALLEFLSGGDEKKEKILKEYWFFLDELKKKAATRNKITDSVKVDKEEAEEWIEILLNHGIQPILTCPREYWEEIKKGPGISAKESWIPGFKNIAGTLGIQPYHQEKDRITLKIKARPDELEPRITGKKPTFYGIVGFKKGFIPLENIEVI